MASKFTVGTPNTLGKVWNIDVEREYRKLSYLFQNPERNNGIITESLRQLKTFIHQQSSTITFHRFFKENLSEFEIAWEVTSLLLKLLQNIMKQKDEAFAKVVWIQIANLIKMVQFRCGSKFTVLPTDGKNSDQWRRKSRILSEPNSSDSMELTRIEHFLISIINVLPLELMHRELKKKEIKRFCLPINFVDHLLLNHVERR